MARYGASGTARQSWSPGGSGMKGRYSRTVNLFIQRICKGTLTSSFGTLPKLWITLPPGARTFTRLTDLELLLGPRMKAYRVTELNFTFPNELSLDYMERNFLH